jgi:hypothetical protein
MAEANPVLDLINSQTTKAISQSGDLLQSNMDLVRRTEQYATAVSTEYSKVAKAQELVSLTKGFGDLQAQQAIQRDAFAAGMDPGSTSNDMIDALAKHRTETHKLEDLLGAWDKNQSIRFFDDPEAWVKARFNEGNLRGSIERTAASADFQNKRAMNLGATVQTAVVTEKAIASTITAASVEAQATIVSAEARIAAEKAALEGFAANTKGVQFALTATEQQLGYLAHQSNAQNQAKNTEIALRQVAVSEATLEERKAAWEDRKDGKTIDEFVTQRIVQGRLNFGYTGDISPAAAKSYLQLYKTGDPEIVKFFHSGDKSLTAGRPIIGATPAESARVLNSGHNLPEGREGAVGILSRGMEAALAKRLDPKKNPDEYNKAVNDYVKEEVTRDATNITPTSPRWVGDLKSYLGDPNTPHSGLAALMALPISQKVFIPVIQAGQPLSDPTLIRSLGKEAVFKGVITSSEYSSGLSAIFTRANEINLQSNDYVGLGIQIPNAGKNYPVRKGVFAGKIDMMNATELGTDLAQDLAKRLLAIEQGKQVGRTQGNFK